MNQLAKPGTNLARRDDKGSAVAANSDDQAPIFDLLKTPKTVAMMQAIVPRHITHDRMIRLATLAVSRTPKLALCKPYTLLGAFLSCSALGLEPNTPLQHVHLIPFENRKKGITEVQVIIGYRGYMELGRRSGLIRAQHAEVAFSGDEFEVEFGTETRLRHVPRMDGADRGEPLAAYCYVKLDDGQAFSVMPWADVLKIRDGSQGYKTALRFSRTDNPWQAHPIRMGRKTAIRNLYGGGEVPLSLEMAGALAIDERRVDFAALADASAEEIKEGMGSFSGDDDEEDNANQPEAEGKPAEREEPKRTRRAPAAAEEKPKATEPEPERQQPRDAPPPAEDGDPGPAGDDGWGDVE